MDIEREIYEATQNGTITAHYSALEIAGSFATVLSLLIAVLCILGSLLSIGAAFVFLFLPDRKLLPTIFGPPLLGLGFYALALFGGLASLGLWSGVALIGLSYPLLRHRALRRAKRILGGSSRESVAKP